MGYMRISFLSRVLGFHTNATVILPSDRPMAEGQSLEEACRIGERFPVLYLLHGGGGNAFDWPRFTGVERYAEERGMAVVMPEVGATSFYSDMVHGYPYFTFLSEELPTMMETLFPIGGSREKRFVAGLSMGGYGTLKWAFRKPEFFSAAAALSGSSLVMEIFDQGFGSSAEDDKRSMVNLNWGGLEKLRNSPDDTRYMLDRIGENPSAYPALYVAIGTEDPTYEYTGHFMDYAKKCGIPIRYEEGPGGHEWKFWDAFLPRAMDWCLSEAKKQKE